MSTTLRVSEETRDTVRELARQAGEPASEIVAKAIEAYRRKLILDMANEAYARLRADPEAWREEEAERRLWEATLADGLEDD